MALYLYAIAPASLPRLRVKGFGGASVRRIRHGGLLAMASEITGAPAVDEESLRVHQAVLDRLFARATILPIRFGTILAGEEAARRLLAERGETYLQALARLEGKAEICVRVLWPEREPPLPPREEGPGRIFLAKRLEAMAACQAYRTRAVTAADEVHGFLLEEAKAGILQMGRGRFLFSAYYLVPKEDPAAFIRQCEQARARWPAYAFTITGPWPPAAFAARLTGEKGGENGRPHHLLG